MLYNLIEKEFNFVLDFMVNLGKTNEAYSDAAER